tara:strand:+ start:194 stop:463 length:270 start_codon:yes stop_codon:yes gene_type:complete
MPCYFCEKNPKEHYLGYYCEYCRKIKNILNIYGVNESLSILESVCIRNEDQRNRKINLEKKKIIQNNAETELTKSQNLYDKPNTRSQKK